MKFVDGIPRRRRPELTTPEEKLVSEAIKAVEKLGPHQLLTECMTMLGNAREKLADWVERGETVVVPKKKSQPPSHESPGKRKVDPESGQSSP